MLSTPDSKIKQTKTSQVSIPFNFLCSFLLHLILCLHRSFLSILLSPKEVRLYISKNIYQLVCLIDQINLFRKVNNRSVIYFPIVEGV